MSAFVGGGRDGHDTGDAVGVPHLDVVQVGGKARVCREHLSAGQWIRDEVQSALCGRQETAVAQSIEARERTGHVPCDGRVGFGAGHRLATAIEGLGERAHLRMVRLEHAPVRRTHELLRRGHTALHDERRRADAIGRRDGVRVHGRLGVHVHERDFDALLEHHDEATPTT